MGYLVEFLGKLAAGISEKTGQVPGTTGEHNWLVGQNSQTCFLSQCQAWSLGLLGWTWSFGLLARPVAFVSGDMPKTKVC